MSNNIQTGKTISLEDTINQLLTILENLQVNFDKTYVNKVNGKAKIYNINKKTHKGTYNHSIFTTKEQLVASTSPFVKTISQCCANNKIIDSQKLINAVQNAIKYLAQVRRAKHRKYVACYLNDVFQGYELVSTKKGNGMYTYNASTAALSSTAAEEFAIYITNIKNEINKYTNETEIPPSAIIINTDDIIAASAVTNYISKINQEYNKWLLSRDEQHINSYSCHVSVYCHCHQRSRR